MSWLGKIIGGVFGFALAGPLGLILGVFFGHNLDKRTFEASQLRNNRRGFFKQNAEEQTYFNALFTVMGSVAKADGRVSENEIHYAREVMANMGLNRSATSQAIYCFNNGKNSAFKVGEVVARLHEKVSPDHVVVQSLLEALIGMAYVDGPMTVPQRAVLLQVCEGLGISRLDFDRLETMIRAQHEFYRAYTQQKSSHNSSSSQDQQNYSRHSNKKTMSTTEAYSVLDITSSATDAEIKKAYRRLISRHHPDKLIAQGLSEEMIKLATAKAQKIKAAYDVLKEERGF